MVIQSQNPSSDLSVPEVYRYLQDMAHIQQPTLLTIYYLLASYTCIIWIKYNGLKIKVNKITNKFINIQMF